MSSSTPARPDAQRLRTSCDTCKRLKIRCEREGKSCLRCMLRKEKCVTTFATRKQPQPTRLEQIHRLENRIERMESLLAASGLERWGSSPQSTPASETTDELSALLVDDPQSVYIGSSSGLSLFSPAGLKWIADTTGRTDLDELVRCTLKVHAETSLGRDPALWHPLPVQERRPLPPKTTADRYVNCFFESLNTLIPLYDERLFRALYDRQYSSDPETDVAWYASFNIVLAVGSMMSSQTQVHPPGPADFESDDTWQYFRHACSVFTDLLFTSRRLMAVQALLAMAFIFDMLLDSESASTVVAGTTRLAISLGLHRRPRSAAISTLEKIQRQNVFWSLYICEKLIHFRIGRPSMINDTDIELEPPADGETINERTFFSNLVKLTQIEGEIYSQIHSARHLEPGPRRSRLIDYFDNRLREWRNGLPVAIMPEEPILCSPEYIHTAIMLHFAYFNSVVTLHRLSIYNELSASSRTASSLSMDQHPDIPPRVYSSHLTCLAAARNSAKLLLVLDHDSRLPRDNILRHLLYYPLSAFLILFVNALQNPCDSYIESDLHLLQVVIDYLSPALPSVNLSFSTSALKIFRRLKDIAEQYVGEIQLQRPARLKRARDQSPQRGFATPETVETSFESSYIESKQPKNNHPPTDEPPSPGAAAAHNTGPSTTSDPNPNANAHVISGLDPSAEEHLFNPFLLPSFDFELSGLWYGGDEHAGLGFPSDQDGLPGFF
ncbi:fungal-specific transcription factor domain-containing protein [Aspergillus unguis]